MQNRELGQLRTPVSAIGYGALSLTNFYGRTDDDGANAILTACLDLGIDHVDTSNVYGPKISEERIGAFLAKQGKQAGGMLTTAQSASEGFR